MPGKPRKARNRHANASSQQNRPGQSDTAEPTRLTWAQRLKRAFEFDVTVCTLCGGTLRVIADVTDPAIIDKILTHTRQSRAPPGQAQAQRRASSTPLAQQTNRIA